MISSGPTEEQEVGREAMRDFASQAMRAIARGLLDYTRDDLK